MFDPFTVGKSREGKPSLHSHFFEIVEFFGIGPFGTPLTPSCCLVSLDGRADFRFMEETQMHP